MMGNDRIDETIYHPINRNWYCYACNKFHGMDRHRNFVTVNVSYNGAVVGRLQHNMCDEGLMAHKLREAVNHDEEGSHW